jgi:hypothetical protein
MIQCSTYKNKIDKVQCPNKCKKGLNFCGKHKNCKEIDIIYKTQPDNTDNIYIETKNYNLENIISKNDLVVKNEVTVNINVIESSGNIKIDRYSKHNIYKKLEKTIIYDNFLDVRKTYIRENPKHIELIDYIENNKLDSYPIARLSASLDFYKLVKKSESFKFAQTIDNIAKLNSFFITLLTTNQNIPSVIKLQRFIRKSMTIYNDNLRGPALKNRSLCVNDSDFYSLDDIKDIPNVDFFSFTDSKGFIYGYHIDSIIELILKSDEYFDQFKKNYLNNNGTSNLCYRQFIRTLYNHYNKLKIINPYTRFIIEGPIKLRVIKLFAQKQFNKKPNNNQIEVIDIKTSVRNKCLTIFQKIDFQGYQTDIYWLYEESQKVIKIFYKKLSIIWNFEFGLNQTARYNIAKSHNIFDNLHDIMISRADKYTLLDKVLDTVNAIVSNGDTEADKQSGCIIVLYALAYINQNCIIANPWLA